MTYINAHAEQCFFVGCVGERAARGSFFVQLDMYVENGGDMKKLAAREATIDARNDRIRGESCGDGDRREGEREGKPQGRGAINGEDGGEIGRNCRMEWGKLSTKNRHGAGILLPILRGSSHIMGERRGW